MLPCDAGSAPTEGAASSLNRQTGCRPSQADEGAVAGQDKGTAARASPSPSPSARAKRSRLPRRALWGRICVATQEDKGAAARASPSPSPSSSARAKRSRLPRRVLWGWICVAGQEDKGSAAPRKGTAACSRAASIPGRRAAGQGGGGDQDRGGPARQRRASRGVCKEARAGPRCSCCRRRTRATSYQDQLHGMHTCQEPDDCRADGCSGARQLRELTPGAAKLDSGVDDDASGLQGAADGRGGSSGAR